jgi:hypothetical protein
MPQVRQMTMNVLPEDKASALKALFLAGMSIREAMRETGVGKHTALRYQRMCNGHIPPAMPTRKGLGISLAEGLCRYMKQSERVEFWEKIEGPIPDGMRLGSTCRMAYCGFLEHMILVENKNAGDNKWSQLVDIKALAAMPVGAYVEFQRPASSKLMNQLRARMAMKARFPHAFRTSKDGTTARLYKLGSNWEWGRRPAEAEELAARIAVEWNPRTVGSFDRRMRSGAPSIWLGQFRQTPEDTELLSRPRWSECSVKGCVYPHNGSDKCRYHGHFFDFKWSMEWRGVAYSDIRPTDKTPVPLFSSMQAWEMPQSAERTVFEHNGTRDKGRKLSDDWWREHVEKYQAEAQAKAGMVKVRVIGQSKPQYASEDRITNIQHTGAFILWKGFGRKKIRKKQRMRPQGWHGNHPEQKPRERFTRDTLEDCPMWAPQPYEQREVQNEEIYLDDDYTPLFEDEQIESFD